MNSNASFSISVEIIHYFRFGQGRDGMMQDSPAAHNI